MNDRLRLITVFGMGHLRPAPGTWGSLPPIAIAAGALMLGAAPVEGRWPTGAWIAYHAPLAGLFLAAALACALQGDRAEARFNRKDPSEAVADETAGQCIPLMVLPGAALATPALAAFTLMLTFVSFRIFDILKPWPARHVQRVPGGWGILLDDLIAGLYAAILVQIASRLAL